tara:strand:+ start:448 stop:1053 length:606 start_codon:yes stop_codon:yes gene_type:complete
MSVDQTAFEQYKLDVKDRQDSLEETIRLQNQKVNTDMIELRQALNVQYPHHGEDEDNMDILVSGHLRDVSREPRPQMSGAGLASSNKHFRDLTNHELHQIKKIHEEDHKQKPRTVLDEPLGEIMNKCVNFLTYSFDGYTKKLYEAELMEDIHDEDKSTYESIKIHLIAMMLFFRDDENVLYIGILLVFLSIIIYLVNITTS